MPPLLRQTLLALCLGLALPCLHAADAPASEPPAAAAAGQEGEKQADGQNPDTLPRQLLDERSSEGAAGLERQLPRIEQQQLQAGDEQFLALWKPANVAEATGVVILVPGADESADWPSVISPLRSKLPDSGWSTLSLTLPDSPTAPLPTAVLPRPPAATSEVAAADKQDKTA
ncbi:MAG TPA: DUF3530 family protein, partial [Pseudomonas sp.]|nr:DUF3530 family protein [Pseudomonas sp.]